MTTGKYIIVTKDGKFAANESNLGLKDSWSTERAKAHVFTEEKAAFWLRRMNAMIPNHARMQLVEVVNS